MLLRLLQKGSCLLTGKNLCISVNPTNSPVHLIWSHGFSQSLGIKAGLSSTNVAPYSVDCAVQIKILTWNILRNGLKKTCNVSRYRKISKVWCGQSLACSRNLRNYGWKDVLSVFQKMIRCNLRESRNLTRVALGSSLLMAVPSSLFTKEEVNKEKMITIEIPKETIKPKRKKSLLANIYNFIRLFLRALRLFFTFVPILTLYPVTYLGERPTDAWWYLLLRAVEFSGPILVKLGQWVSTRRDLFPDSCCRQFAHLQRRIEPHSWAFTVYRMKQAFGPNWRKVFVLFDNNRKPVGCGCVAQVYKVWMAKDAVPDQELLEEIISDMDDENSNEFEGLEILGFSKKILGFGEDDDAVQKHAVEEWRRTRDLQRLKEEEMEKEVNESLVQESGTESLDGLELDHVSTVTDSLASDIVSGEGFQPLEKENGNAEETSHAEAEVEEHSLVEVWEEADHTEKSLPIEESPPDDLDGLIPVAIKVLHPAVHSCVRRDLRILRACAWFITSLYPPLRWLTLPECVDEFSEVMSGQVNLKVEAKNLDLFSENFADVTSIKFPKPLRPYVTREVIVETYEDGEGMGEFIGSCGEDKADELKTHLAKIGVDALLKMVFLDNFVHGDLHPGNMLIQNINVNEDGTNASPTGDNHRIMMVDVGYDTFVMDVQPDPNPVRICLLDCGVVAKLKQHDLANFKAVFKQIVLGDGESVADLFLENSEHNCKDPEAFKADMTKLVTSAREDTISLAQIDVGVLLQQFLGILLRHQVRLESAFSAVVLAVFVLEGLGRTLDPNMDILERARPILVTGKVPVH